MSSLHLYLATLWQRAPHTCDCRVWQGPCRAWRPHEQWPGLWWELSDLTSLAKLWTR